MKLNPLNSILDPIFNDKFIFSLYICTTMSCVDNFQVVCKYSLFTDRRLLPSLAIWMVLNVVTLIFFTYLVCKGFDDPKINELLLNYSRAIRILANFINTRIKDMFFFWCLEIPEAVSTNHLIWREWQPFFLNPITKHHLWPSLWRTFHQSFHFPPRNDVVKHTSYVLRRSRFRSASLPRNVMWIYHVHLYSCEYTIFSVDL